MKVKIDLARPLPKAYEVGNVYRCRGGRALRDGNYWVLLAYDDQRRSCVLLMVDTEGNIVGADTRALHCIEDQVPIAYVEGLEDLELIMRSVP